jgi:hypothetical protein
LAPAAREIVFQGAASEPRLLSAAFEAAWVTWYVAAAKSAGARRKGVKRNAISNLDMVFLKVVSRGLLV